MSLIHVSPQDARILKDALDIYRAHVGQHDGLEACHEHELATQIRHRLTVALREVRP